ncbi:MAG: hypothetical protein Q8Q85_10790, partial [Gemmatimonadales bacterium]|nr:hypothetical protein [Gemmatimonadales bacterium]
TLIRVLIAENAEQRAFFVEFLRQLAPDSFQRLPDPLALRAGAVAFLDSLLREHPDAADAFALRGTIKAALPRVGGTDSLLESAIADLERAKLLDPPGFEASSYLASAYTSAGRYSDALFAYGQALEADVFQRQRADNLRGSFDAALMAEHYPDADTACRTGQREFPRDERFRDCELRLLSRTGLGARAATRAVAIADSLTAIEANQTWRALYELYAAAALARAGRGRDADRMAARATAISLRQPILQLELAWVRLQRGDADSALALLAGLVRSDPSYRRNIVIAPWFKALRSDPRFGAALSGVSPTSRW